MHQTKNVCAIENVKRCKNIRKRKFLSAQHLPKDYLESSNSLWK